MTQQERDAGTVESSSTARIIWQLLAKTDRIALIGIFVLVLIGTVLETVSLGLVVPTISLLTRDNYSEQFPSVVKLLGNPTQATLVIVMMLALVIIYATRSGFLLWSTWIQRGFATSVSARLTQRLFTIYLRQPYMFHLERNSALLIRNAQNASMVISGGIDPFLVLLTEGLVVFALLGLLLAVQPIGTTVVIVVFGSVACTLNRMTHGRLRRWGEAQNFHSWLLLQNVQQGLGAAKDIKILGRETEFLRQHEKHLVEGLRAYRLYSVLQSVPRAWMEVLTIGGLAALVITMIAQGQKLPAIAPTLGLFAAAAFRVMPSVNRLVNGAQTVIYSRAAISAVFEDFKLSAPELSVTSEVVAFREQVELRDVTFYYPHAHRPALHMVSLFVKKGEAVGFVGPSGAGKSTLVDVILGLFEPSSGKVLVDSTDIQINLRNWQSQIGYVPQSIYLTDDTLRRNVAFGLEDSSIDEDAVNEAIRLAQLEEFIGSLPANLDTFVGERGIRLSGGQRQRIGIARALYHSPSVLVLDEATSSLDIPTERDVMQAVQALQGTKTVIIVAHRLSTVEYCDRLYRLEDSRIVEEGTFVEVAKPRRLP